MYLTVVHLTIIRTGRRVCDLTFRRSTDLRPAYFEAYLPSLVMRTPQ